MQDCNRRNAPVMHRLPRPYDNWFDYYLFDMRVPESKFRKKMRMDRRTFWQILQLCAADLQREVTNLKCPLPVYKVFAIGVYRLAHGASFNMTADSFCVGETTVREAFNDVLFALNRLSKSAIKFPQTTSEKAAIIAGFNKLSKLKNILGAVDGTHIKILKPVDNAKDYFSRYQEYDVTCQGTCDSKSQFTNFACAYPGSMHDSNVFKNSKLSEKVSEGFRVPSHLFGDVPVAPFLVGDSAYVISESLMKPFSDSTTNPQERHFNKELSKARVKIENAFGILKSRWLILELIKDNLAVIPDLINACVILHNLCIKNSDFWEQSPNVHLDYSNIEVQIGNRSGELLRNILKDDIYEE